MRKWVRRRALVAAIGLTLAACATDGGTQDSAATGSSGVVETTTTSQTSTPSTEASGGEETTTTTAEVSDPPLVVEGPAAPDFTFALADGSSFSLSEEQKPVYLVFWAEW